MMNYETITRSMKASRFILLRGGSYFILFLALATAASAQTAPKPAAPPAKPSKPVKSDNDNPY